MKKISLVILALTLTACAHNNHSEAIGKLDDDFYHHREKTAKSGDTTYKSTYEKKHTTEDIFDRTPTKIRHSKIKRTPSAGPTTSKRAEVSWKF